MNLLNVIESMIMFRKEKYSYSELYTFYYDLTGNGSISSFEKFLTFCYGQQILRRKGKLHERSYHLNRKKIKGLIAKYRGDKSGKS